MSYAKTLWGTGRTLSRASPWVTGGALLLAALAPARGRPPHRRAAWTQTSTPEASQLHGHQLALAGYNRFYNLDFDAALADFQKLTLEKPSDPAAWNHLAQARLYREMYRIGALESQLYGHGDPFLEQPLPPPNHDEVLDFLRENQQAINFASAAIRQNPNDASAHYQLAVAWAMRGSYEFVLQKSYFAALGDALKARKEAEKAHQLQPKSLDPLLILGVHNYIAGSLPWAVKLVASMAGYGGSKQKGIQQLEEVAHSDAPSSTDAEVLLAVIERRQGNNRDVVNLLIPLVKRYPENVLYAVELAEAAEAAGMHAFAWQQYHAILDRARIGAPGYQRTPLDKVWYDIGNIDRLFSRFDAALADYGRAASARHAQTRYIQAALLAAGEVADLVGRREVALADYRRCIALRPDAPAARAARRYIGKPYRK
jgi:tetratricopeptide (TPR) repeat protein